MDDLYGDDVEFRIEEEDREPITKPLIEVQSKKNFCHRIPPITDDFLLSLMNVDHAIRNVAIIGHLLHGKTTFVDCLVSKYNFEPKRFTDSLFIEQERGISVKSSPISICIKSLREKSYAFNIIDTPGHVNMSDEVTAAMRIADGVLLVVDACDGVMLNTELLLKHAVQQGQSVMLCINKLDRLILELRLPPNDAYHKLKRLIDEVNELIMTYTYDEDKLISPLLGNVCFASSKYSVCFTLKSFAKLYIERSKTYSITYKQLASKLWGDQYLDGETSRFVKEPPEKGSKRSFVEYILEPLYKLHRVIIESPNVEYVDLAEKYKLSLPKNYEKMNVGPLLKDACSQLFGSFSSFADMCSEFIPSPRESVSKKLPLIWQGPNSSPLTQAIYRSDPEGPLVVQVVKQYLSIDGLNFHMFGRVMSGTIKPYTELRILGECYTEEDDEDSRVVTIGRIWIHNTRFDVAVKAVPAGNWVLIECSEQPIIKTCTIVDLSFDDTLYVFRPLKFNTRSIVKVAVEPVSPSELPKMLDGLRKCNKSYPILQTKVEESGEHVMMGTGELYLDCVMHDLRKLFTEIEIRVSDPVVCFSETVTAISEYTCIGESTNKKNLIKMIAEPLEEGLAGDLEECKISIDDDQRDMDKFFKKNYGWDDLTCRSIWAFGPEVDSTNLLLNETLPYEVDSKLLTSIREPIIHAFHWATREGPLCEEPMRSVKFKLVYADIAKEMIHRNGGQIIPTARRVSYLSFLKAGPRMMEPYVFTEIIAPPDVVIGAVSGRDSKRSILEDIVVEKRRGKITKKEPIPGTPLYRVEALMPAIDSFGFETDLRSRTTGQAFCQSVFDRWVIVPGDPLDINVDQYLVPLEPQQTKHLAREFLLKTRRRKGLCDDVSIDKFIDDSMRIALETEEDEENMILDFDHSFK